MMRSKQLICFASFVLMLSVIAGTPPVSSAQIIDSVVRGGSSPHTPPVIAPNPLDEDELCFVDRTHQYNDIPIDLLGAEYVMVANNDKTQADYSLEITLFRTTVLYLFLDNRLGHYDFPGHDPFLDPDLLAAGMGWVYDMGFIDTGQNIGIDEEGDGDIDQWSSVYIMDLPHTLDLAGSTFTLLQQNDATNPGVRNMYGFAALPTLCCIPRLPPNGAVDVPLDTNLSWVHGDGAVQEEVYFGTDPNALPLVDIILNLPQFPPLYDPPGDLIASTTYYWQIVEVNGIDRFEGDVWEFTTIRGQAQPEYPVDGALIQGDDYPFPPATPTHIFTPLVFIPGPTAVKHTGYFSDDYAEVAGRVQDANLGPPPYLPYAIFGTTYYVGIPHFPPANDTLVRGQKYYWTVDETDALGNKFAGVIWEFAIHDFCAFAPTPVDGANDVDPNVLLSWWPGFDVQEHDVYMGTSWEDVNNAVYNFMTLPPEFVTTTAEPNSMVTGLPKGIKQYWRVDQVSGRFPPISPGTVYKGPVWEFTTTPPDLNNDGFINFKDYAIPSNYWKQTGPNLPGDFHKDDVIDYKDLRILMEHWLWNL
jgi:hypothetical protein